MNDLQRIVFLVTIVLTLLVYVWTLGQSGQSGES